MGFLIGNICLSIITFLMLLLWLVVPLFSMLFVLIVISKSMIFTIDIGTAVIIINTIFFLLSITFLLLFLLCLLFFYLFHRHFIRVTTILYGQWPLKVLIYFSYKGALLCSLRSPLYDAIYPAHDSCMGGSSMISSPTLHDLPHNCTDHFLSNSRGL